uniref:G_PROTEIN_RECEP_F1_2 domain-containing protein n=1 Tax=Angiostrongylus cantonensis TaxID=6313 RepID=A0A0K0CSX6_ANGCA
MKCKATSNKYLKDSRNVFQAIKARLVSRKCYILLLNRAIGDLVSCLVALVVCAYVLLWPEINRDMVNLMESFFTGSFWSAMVSYVALSVLKLFAVWRPFHYRKWFTMKRCINLITLSWVMFILMVSYTLGVTALVKVAALNEWSGCRMETCARAMYRWVSLLSLVDEPKNSRSRNVFTVSVYFFTLVVFLVTVLLIRRAQRFVDSFKKRESNESEGGRWVRFPLWKLAINVATFAVLYLFYVIWCIGLLLIRDQCFFQRHLPEMMRILAFVRSTLLLRIVVDPILSFITDFQVHPHCC